MFYKKKKTEGPKSKKTKGRLLQGGSTFDKNVQKWAGNVKIFWLPFDDLVFVSIAASSWKKYLENYPVYVMCGAHRRGRGRQGWNGIKKKKPLVQLQQSTDELIQVWTKQGSKTGPRSTKRPPNCQRTHNWSLLGGNDSTPSTWCRQTAPGL